MAWAKEIKRKITSIKNTGKITKAMELISTVKMKKAQDLANSKKNFILEILKIFLRIRDELAEFPLFQPSLDAKKTLGIVITSNKGLCWGYNVNIFKKVNTYMKENNEEIEFMSLGKKAARFVAKTGNRLLADFSDIYTDHFDTIHIKNISRSIREEFLTGKYKKVVIFYTHFQNTIKQVAVDWEFLPVDEADIETYLRKVAGEFFDLQEEEKKFSDLSGYLIEPSVQEIANEVVPMVLDMMFYDVILEAKASEHSSRMIAMKNAKDNAKKIAGSLTLKYNKARQSIITKEVSEITAWVESLKD